MSPHGEEHGSELDLSAGDGSTFLALLDACVRRDAALPGFRGKLAVGVSHGLGALWWEADFSSQARTRFVEGLSEDVDAALFMCEHDAAAVLLGEDIRDDREAVPVFGDRDLLLRFFDRYVETQTLLGHRAKRAKGEK